MQALAHVATLARLAAIAAVLALVGVLGVRPAVDGDAAARAMGPLPACRYDDILTSPRAYGDWSKTLVDTILRVPKTYAPPDLVRVVDLGIPGRGKVRAVMATDLQAMSAAAAAAGAPIGVQSAYRSYTEQQTVFAHWVEVHGYARALQLSARPGHSEHQLGLAIDFRSDPPVDTLMGSWGATPAGTWMRNHAWEYGFVMSYPKGKIKLVCYDYEPWHFRYVGRPLAAKIHGSGLTPRQYLWANFTTTVVPPPTPKPSATAAVSHVPSLSPTVAPTPSPTPTVTQTARATTTPPTPRPSASVAASASAPPVPNTPPGGTPAAGGATALTSVLWIAGAIGAAVVLVLATAMGLSRRGRGGRSGVGL